MLTIFTLPKPFRGQIAVIQRNAIGSWSRLRPAPQIVLFGDEPGTTEAATELGAEHEEAVATNEHGTPRLDDVFARGERLARHELLCYANADLILLGDVLGAVEQVRARWARFVLVGQSRNLDVPNELTFESDWEDELRTRAGRVGSRRGAGAIDYLVFTRGVYASYPPFALGRAGFDNWLVWRARDLGVPVVDATRAVTAIHQTHDYDHLAGGKLGTYQGPEALENVRLAGGKRCLYSIFDASHLLTERGIRPSRTARFRLKERSRRMAWKLGARTL